MVDTHDAGFRKRVSQLRGDLITAAAGRLAAAMTRSAERLAKLVESEDDRTALAAAISPSTSTTGRRTTSPPSLAIAVSITSTLCSVTCASTDVRVGRTCFESSASTESVVSASSMSNSDPTSRPVVPPTSTPSGPPMIPSSSKPARSCARRAARSASRRRTRRSRR